MVRTEGYGNGAHPKQQLIAISAKAKGHSRHLDGDGLYLVVDPGGARRWVLRIMIRRKRVDIGLGGMPLVTTFPLHGVTQRAMADDWSVTVNGNWRITFRFVDGDADVVDYLDYH